MIVGMTIRTLIFVSAIGGALALSACSDTRDVLGLTNKPPDEFAVVDHPPLSMPPDYSLRPPAPGAEARRGDSPSEKAAKALYGDDKMELVQQQGVSRLNMQGLSSSEQSLLQQSAASQADPAIRSQLDREAREQVISNRKLIDEILFWRKPKPAGAVINAPAESERIKAAKDQGQPINAGETKGIERGKEITIP